MVVGNHQCKVANLNQSKAQFQLELSLAEFSPSLLILLFLLRAPQLLLYKFFYLSTPSKRNENNGGGEKPEQRPTAVPIAHAKSALWFKSTNFH